MTWASATYSSMSGDGRYVGFISNATDLGPGGNSKSQVFVTDRQTNTMELISRSTADVAGDDHCYDVALSADGRYVAFQSSARKFSNGVVYVRDRNAGTLEVMSVNQGGSAANSWSAGVLYITPNGRYVTFTSSATNLVPNDLNGSVPDVFLRDRQLGATELISRSTDGTAANGGSGDRGTVVSDDGRYVVFSSSASNLVTGDTNGQVDVFKRDLGLQPDTSLRYRVYAYNSGGTSAEGNTLTVRTLPLPPGAPTRLLLTPVSDSRIDLTWVNGRAIQRTRS